MIKFFQKSNLLSTRQRHFVCPTLLFLLLIFLIAWFSLDLKLADMIFQGGGNAWILRENWITEDLIHQGGRNLVALLLLTLIGLIASTYLKQDLKQYRTGLWYILVTALISALLVNILKQTTGLDCPWDLSRYGGNKVFLGFFENNYLNQDVGRCFPAGHASAAYAWFGVYYFARRNFPKYQWLCLTCIIITGLIFGIAQQLRGAHFLSHDLWTAWICWITASAAYYLYFKPVMNKNPA